MCNFDLIKSAVPAGWQHVCKKWAVDTSWEEGTSCSLFCSPDGVMLTDLSQVQEHNRAQENQRMELEVQKNVQVNNQTKIACEKCNETFFNMSMKRQHERNVHRINHIAIHKCSICSRSFPLEYLLSEHMRILHQTTQQQNKKATETVVYKQQVCTDEDLKLQQLYQERERQRIEKEKYKFMSELSGNKAFSPKSVLVQNSKKLQCPNCPETFFSFAMLQKHRRNNHNQVRNQTASQSPAFPPPPVPAAAARRAPPGPPGPLPGTVLQPIETDSAVVRSSVSGLAGAGRTQPHSKPHPAVAAGRSSLSPPGPARPLLRRAVSLPTKPRLGRRSEGVTAAAAAAASAVSSKKRASVAQVCRGLGLQEYPVILTPANRIFFNEFANFEAHYKPLIYTVNPGAHTLKLDTLVQAKWHELYVSKAPARNPVTRKPRRNKIKVHFSNFLQES